VIGFDDVAQAALAVPSLSTVRQPMESMGSISAGMILDSISGANQKRDVTPMRRRVPAELVARESTRPVSKPG
jgi:LacI family transcriptional regulator